MRVVLTRPAGFYLADWDRECITVILPSVAAANERLQSWAGLSTHGHRPVRVSIMADNGHVHHLNIDVTQQLEDI